MDEARNRGGYGEERYETKEFQEKVLKAYMQLKTEDDSNKEQLGVGTIWGVLNASQPINSVAKEIFEIAQEAICTPKLDQMGKLWMD